MQKIQSYVSSASLTWPPHPMFLSCYKKEVLDKEKGQLYVQLGFAKCMKYACIMYLQ